MSEASVSAPESRHAERSKISARWILRISECLKDTQHTELLREALRAASINEQDLAASHNIQQRQLDQIIDHILPQVPDITLRLFARAELTDLGVIGYAAINSGTVGEALNILLRYQELTSDRFRDIQEIIEDTVTITPVPIMGYQHEYRNIAEDSLAGNWRSLKLLTGNTTQDDQALACFDFPAPEYARSYQQVFQCPVQFNAQRTELRFPANWLERPIETANRSMAEVCNAMCERLLGTGQSHRDTAQMVRRLLLSRPGRRMYRLEEAANALQLSPGQLRKRLYQAGTSYKRLVLETRMNLARHYLLDTDLSVQEIAYLLDYSQPAPFSRAFFSHAGVWPDHYRKTALRAEM